MNQAMERIIEIQDKLFTIQVDSLTNMIMSFMFCVVLNIILSRIYINNSTSFSDKEILSRILVPLSLIVLLVITVVKSSLALSLGLVGALSIVRFRTPIKEPEDLVYIFISIGIGLSLGAGAWKATIIGSAAIFIFLIFRQIFKSNIIVQTNLLLNIRILEQEKPNTSFELDTITSAIEKNCKKIELHRFDENQKNIEISYNVEINDPKFISSLINDLRRFNNKTRTINFTIMDPLSGKIF